MALCFAKLRAEVLNMTLYHCPDCHRVHDDPFEARLGLEARCFDCALDDDYADYRLSTFALQLAA